MRISVLGSLQVEGDDTIAVRGPQVGRLLAALVIDAGRVVSVDRLADIVFDGQPTDAAATTLRSHVARLRRLVPDDGTGVAIVASRPGYRLELGTSTVDAHEFESLLEQARRGLADGEPGRALTDADAALALWRGPAFAEFADEEWARLEALRLAALHEDATELRLRALVATGQHGAAVADLARFVEEHPLREEAWSALVLALHRSGRQTEALRAAAGFRRTVGDSGLEPSDEFVCLERQVASRDPRLDAADVTAKRLRGYRIVEKLSRGRHGTVHLAVQPGVEREVVLRTLDADVADDPEFIRRFPMLVQRVGRLEHPHLVPLLDFWREPGAAHLVTRFVPGGSLADLIAKGPAPVERVATIIQQAADALDAAHRAGAAHGALDAGEVLLGDGGEAFVDGIGVASFVEQLAGGTTPPEPPAARDQHGLAVLAHDTLTGRAGRGAGHVVSADRPELLALDGVFARATASDPADRYPDIVAFARAFLRAVGRPIPAYGRRAVANPYKGLRAFGEPDAGDFCGREAVVDRLVTRLLGDAPAARLVTVVGASGSGKSSVVRAGLLPRLHAGAVPGSEHWFTAAMAPGSDPFTAWDDAVRQIAVVAGGETIDSRRHGIATSVRRAVPAGGELLVVVDQLEELFTLGEEAATREFLDGIVTAVTDPDGRLRVVATLRADLYDRPLGHHRLGELVAAGAVPLIGMSPGELEQAITMPAAGVGIAVEGALVAELVTGVADRPGSLPLLEFTLTELFDQRTADTLSLVGYRQLGGISGAIAARADAVYQRLDPKAQEAARLLFVRLVTLGGDRPDLRRRTPRAELTTIPALADGADRVLDEFGSARLLTFDRDPLTREPTVEVAHEALLRSWPRLAAWIADEGRSLELRADLTVAAALWDRGGRQPADVYRAARLAAIESWAGEHRDDLTAVERAFVDASVEARDAEQREQRVQLRRQRRANRRLRVAVAAIGISLVAALVLGLLAWRQRDRAIDEQAAAERARGRALATTASASIADDRSLALLLAVEASRLDDSPVTRQAVLAALGGDGPLTRTLIPTAATDYSALAVSDDERTAAAKREDGTVDVIDLDRHEVVASGFAGPQNPGSGLAIDPAGDLLVVSGVVADDGAAAVVYRIDGGDVVARIAGEPGAIYEPRFMPDGEWLAIAGPEGRIELYDVADWTLAAALETGDDGRIVTFEPTADGARIVAAAMPFEDGEPAGTSRLYTLDVATGDVIDGPVDAGDWVFALGVDAATETFVAGGDQLRRYELATLEPVGERFGDGFPLGYIKVEVSPDGLVAAASGTALHVFAADEGGVERLPVDAAAISVVFMDAGRSMITADFEGSLWTWTTGWVDDLGESLRPEGPGHVMLSPDGTTLVVYGSGRGVLLFDSAGRELRTELPLGDGDDWVTGVDIDPGGRRVATLTCPSVEDYGPDDACPAVLTVWDGDTGAVLAGPVDAGPVWAWMEDGVAFTGDGEFVVTAEDDAEVQRWDVDTLEAVGPPMPLGDVSDLVGNQARLVEAALAGGRSVVVAVSQFGEVVVWDVTGGTVDPVGAIGGNLSNAGFAGDRLFAAQGSGTFQFHDALTLQPVGAPYVTDVPTFWVSPSDTGLLASSSRVAGAVLWDAATRQQVSGVLASSSAALAQDGSVVFLGGDGMSGSVNGDVVRAVAIDRANLLAEACERAGRNLTAAEWERYLPAGEPYRSTCEQWPAAGAAVSGGRPRGRRQQRRPRGCHQQRRRRRTSRRRRPPPRTSLRSSSCSGTTYVVAGSL